MDFGGINPVTLIATLMVTSVPILLAALGEWWSNARAC
jgi:hypothetical protein